MRYSPYAGDSWTAFKKLARTTDASFDMTEHQGKLCLSHKGNNDSNLYVGCSDNGWSGWNSVTWHNVGNSSSWKAPTLASAFGSLWIGYTSPSDELIVRSSYDNGASWNTKRNIRGAKTYSSFALSHYGTPGEKDEKLCALHRGTTEDGLMWQSCLTGSAPKDEEPGGWTWHQWQRQNGWTNDSPDLATNSEGKLLAQLHRTWNNHLQLRVLQTLDPEGRGYLAHMKWNNPNFSNTRPAYEHEVKLYSGNNDPYNGQTYLSSDTQGGGSCMPAYRYTATNMPQSYVDTRRAEDGTCSSSQYSTGFTIGSTEPQAIDADTSYFTYWSTWKRGLDTPVYQVGAEYSETKKDCEADTWCVAVYPAQKYDTTQFMPSGDGYVNALIDNPDPTRDFTYPFWFSDSWQ